MRLDDLKILEFSLQNSLHAHLGRIVPFRLQCVYKNDTLMVLAQHPADVEIEPNDTFKVLERALQAEAPKKTLSVKLYLRTEGNRRPYRQRSFQIYPTIDRAVPGEAAPVMTVNREDYGSIKSDVNRQTPTKSMSAAAASIQPPASIRGQIVLARANIPAENTLVKIELERRSSSNLDSIAPAPNSPTDAASPKKKLLVGKEAMSIAPAKEEAVRTPSAILRQRLPNVRKATPLQIDAPLASTPPPPVTKPQRNILLPILGGLGLLAVGSGAGYMGTRPCVFGACTVLNTATQVANSSFDLVNNPQSTGKDILNAQQQLHQSVETLASIPVWSSSHDPAQKSIQATTPQISYLDTTVVAMTKAFQATNIVKTPPVPLFKWQESRRLWTESIANLVKVPTNSKVYPLAQQKLTDYRGKLGEIEQRIGAETAADEALKLAVTERTLATQSQSVAKTLGEWQKVKAMWIKVNDKLTSIPSTTIAYPQAQSLLKSHQSQIATAIEKVQEEEKATQTYNIAVRSAADAKLAQKINQLSVAVTHWNQAVVLIQSVPPTSAVYVRAKPLVVEYAKSFQRAEEQLKTAQRIAQATQDLQNTCTGNPQICNYTIDSKGIVVRFTPLYSNTVMQTANTALNRDNNTAKMGILSHVNTLGDALQTISENSQLPIVLYTADGKQIQNYRTQK